MRRPAAGNDMRSLVAPAPARRPRRVHAGQVLVLALVLLGLAGLAWVQLYQGGQLIHEKTRLVHATDAAAYGGAVVQARAFNFLALANRAQVAHQVALAHLVTLDAWAQFGVTEGARAAQGNPPVFLVAALFGAEHGAAYGAALKARGVAPLRPGLAQAMIEHDRVAHEVLWRAQQAVQQTLPVVRERAMQAVLQANFPEAGAAGQVALDPVPLSDDLPGALQAAIGRGADPLRDVALQALADHPFLAPRHHETRNPWVVSARCPGLRHVLRRRGGTRLDADDNWWADDTQAYHALRSNRWIGCYYREYPMGWAETALQVRHGTTALDHIADPPWHFANEPFWRWVQRRTGWHLRDGRDNPLTNSWAVAQRARYQGRGFGGLVDLAASAPPALRLAIRVARPLPALRVAGGASVVRLVGERWLPRWQLPGRQLAALAAAEVVFQAPRRPGVAAEPPSLFTPGWSARLVPARQDERALARQRQVRS